VKNKYPVSRKTFEIFQFWFAKVSGKLFFGDCKKFRFYVKLGRVGGTI